MRLDHTRACRLADRLMTKLREPDVPQALRNRQADILDRLTPIILENARVVRWLDGGPPARPPSRLKRLAAACGLFLLSLVPVHAHDRWADSTPVPPEIKNLCCDEGHDHLIDNASVVYMPDGAHVAGYPYVVPWNKIALSPDGHTWLFYTTQTDGTKLIPICLFRPDPGT